MALYEWIKYDANLVHCLLQYVLSVLHQLLYLSEHIGQADRPPLQALPREQGPAPRRADGCPQKAQTPEHRQLRDAGHLSFSST